ncbi:uncharacterized protein SCHCODRAFT_02682551 [Schizophyllum commune H4-8]|uniref:uncharacterized protein n=1 Tax=Schizophyllum commune (strain H4-8 / FGSC 9210) TaxID=578458 RepID=UPI00215F04DB|nr:uncharacterized protein SCHCODRAFT_02682551 [Schizophyllum commune H4-8]KAI5899556.1 hypothetical protein SCHCODRAFT_02682551 [Schizophyllum commune H4-8]
MDRLHPPTTPTPQRTSLASATAQLELHSFAITTSRPGPWNTRLHPNPPRLILPRIRRAGYDCSLDPTAVVYLHIQFFHTYALDVYTCGSIYSTACTAAPMRTHAYSMDIYASLEHHPLLAPLLNRYIASRSLLLSSQQSDPKRLLKGAHAGGVVSCARWTV